ncbi:MAG: arsenosugar biosynthesis radical SAM (seleno)protein ArsS [Mariprofundaceae bacterium]
MHATLPLLEKTEFPLIRRGELETVQVNLGYLCNQTCVHCHVNAGPRRSEIMDKATVDVVLDFLRVSNAKKLDLTGGAPEMNPNFRYLVSEARKLNVEVMDRCNLTILKEEGQESLAEFLAEHQVEVIASMPCYLEDNVNLQRGKGTFEASIKGLRHLNALGYGRDGSDLTLNLVYNPLGPSLPPDQNMLEKTYKKELKNRYGIVFNHLFTITNMPIQRFGSMLISKGRFDEYMQLLKDAYREENLDGVMCRSMISVGWQGHVYDCDFNQMLGLPMLGQGKPRTHLQELIGKDIQDNPIVVMDHCYGCTAGQGSSCGGALED